MANSTRLVFLDNLRAFVVILVIVLHGSMSYMAYAPTWWYVLDRQTSLVFTMLVLLVDVPIMPIMFFIAGYFALPSLHKRGAKAFVKEKGVRVGLPWVFGALFLAPLTAYMIYVSRQVPMGYTPSVWAWLWTSVLSGLTYLAMRMGAPSSPDAPIVVQTLTALLFSVFCMASLFAGVAIFHEKGNGAGRVWRSLAANSYGMYYIHPLILYPLAYVFVAVTLSLYLKAFVVILLAILLLWVLSAFVLKKVPLLRRVF